MRFLAVVILLLGCSLTALAQDWPYQNPISVTCSGDPLNCANVIPGGAGPSEGYGDFTSAGYPVTFDAITGNPLSWSDFDGQYNATFGYGGTFTVQGPDGTFNGVITWAQVSENDQFQEASMNFTFDGYWSGDGKYYAGSGDSFFRLDSIDGPYAQADISMSTTPEPASFLLLISGIVGAVSYRKRLA